MIDSSKLFFILVAAVAVTLLGVAISAKRLASTPTPTASYETMCESFVSDFRNTICEWDAEDPRPEQERSSALTAFVYQGYGSSVWVPQSLFDTNWITQVVLGDNDTIVRDKIGLVLWPENNTAIAYGMAPNPDRQYPLSWSINCVACHTAEIDGVVYFGAGTKTLDEKMLADAVKMVTSVQGRQKLSQGEFDYQSATHAHEVMRRHHHADLDPLTRARSTAFPASHVEMYMRAHGGKMPRNEEVGRGDVKTPPLWHTAAKIPFERWYCDGSFHAKLPLMASSMELELDQSFDKLVTAVLPTIKKDFETVIRHLRAPRYPYAIDLALAEKGKALFYSNEIGCCECHGFYDGKGNVRWTGIHVDVGTDRARLEVVSKRFIDAFDSSPLVAEGALERSEGYSATPLTGVWANYPYLHNGSVPTLHHLLGPQSARPGVFSVMASRKFDPQRVGQQLYPGSQGKGLSEAELLHKFGSDRDWFNVDRPGCSNDGHDFWQRIKTDANRRALIEYLKTL